MINNKKYVSHSIENYCGNFEKLKLDLIRYIKSGKTVILCVDDRNVVKRIVTYLELDVLYLLIGIILLIIRLILLINIFMVVLFLIIMLLCLLMICLVRLKIKEK